MKKIFAAVFLIFGVLVCFQLQTQAKHPSKQIVVGYGHRTPVHNIHRRMPPPPMHHRHSGFGINIGYPIYPNYYPVYSQPFYPVSYYNYPYNHTGASIYFSI